MGRTTSVGETQFIHNASFKGHVLVIDASGRTVSIPMVDILEFAGRSQKHESDMAMQEALLQEREKGKCNCPARLTPFVETKDLHTAWCNKTKNAGLMPAKVMALHMSPLTGVDQMPETD